MKITILSGGSGCAELVENLWNNDIRDFTIITNLYDNGLSTGEIRREFDGNILGPSDLRKNQLRIHKLAWGETPLYKFLNTRFSGTKEELEDFVFKNIFENVTSNLVNYLRHTKKETFEDYSIANMLYGYLFHIMDADATAAFMEQVLRIPNNSVMVASCDNAYLQAKRKNGNIVEDEADIVSEVSDSPITELFYKNGEKPTIYSGAEYILEQSDIVIISSGTMWSSIFPTLKLEYFPQLRCKVYHLINDEPDTDMLSLTIDEYIETFKTFYPDDITFLSNRTKWNKSFTNSINVSGRNYTKAILFDYFKEELDKVEQGYQIVFDYDGTFPREYKSRNCIILTGNSCPKDLYNCTVYYNRGACLKSRHDSISYLDQYKMSDIEINDIIEKLEIFFPDISEIITNRDNFVLNIKPVKNRLEMMDSISNILFDKNLSVDLAGSTSVEITKKGLSKKSFFDWEHNKNKKIIYFGDEPGGNDYPLKISRDNVHFVHSSVEITRMFMKTIDMYIGVFSR